MIVVAGEALVDLVVTHEGVSATPGGAPYNVARGCARLGLPTALLATVSDDGFGQQLMAGLGDSGVDDHLVQRTSRPTTLAVARLDADGVADYRFYLDGTSAPLLTPGPLPDDARALATGGLALALEPMASAVERLVVGSAPGLLVVVDVNCRPAAIGHRADYVARVGAVMARADVVKVSHEDLHYLHPGTPIEAAARDVLQAGPRVVLVTGGGDATTVITASGSAVVSVSPVPVVDTIGAGDAFTAGFLSWWLRSGTESVALSEAIHVVPAIDAAHAVAAVVVGRRGADPPTIDDLPSGWWP